MTGRISTLLTDLAACLCVQVNTDDKMCFCGVIAGEIATADYFADCENDGLAWVRLAGSYPSVRLGEADQSAGIKLKTIGLDIEVGVIRSHAVDDEGGISAAEYARMSTQTADDLEAIYKTLACCDALDERNFIMGVWRPIGPSGLSYGGAVTVYTTV